MAVLKWLEGKKSSEFILGHNEFEIWDMEVELSTVQFGTLVGIFRNQIKTQPEPHLYSKLIKCNQ